MSSQQPSQQLSAVHNISNMSAEHGRENSLDNGQMIGNINIQVVMNNQNSTQAQQKSNKRSASQSDLVEKNNQRYYVPAIPAKIE